ncbi:MAG: PAS domain-containing sensor histidine kinase [Candidatus Kariarchaeaceae archaeon]|jgi:PAS domain S-box-containing protein
MLPSNALQPDLNEMLIQAPLVAISIDLNHRVLFASRNFRLISKENAVGANLFDCVQPDFHEDLKIHLDIVLKTAQASSYEFNNGFTWFFVQVIPNIVNKTIIGYFIYLVDYGEKKSAELKQIETQKKYETLVQLAPVGIVLVRDDIIQMVNQGLVEMYGYVSDNELIGEEITIIQAEAERRNLQERGKRRIEGKSEPISYESIGLKKNGTTFPIQINVTLVHLDSGLTILGFIQDISERKETESAIIESGANYRDLVETSQDLIWRLDVQGNFTYLNPAWEEVLGYQLDEMLGKKFTDFKEKGDAESSYEAFLSVLDNRIKLQGFETYYVNKSGNKRHMVFNAIPLENTQGEVIGTQGTAIDVTRYKRLEEQLKLSQKMEALGRLTRGIAHDFNNLLSIIQGQSELLLYELGSEDKKYSDIETIIEAVNNGASLVKQLISFSRQSDLKPKRINLNTTVKSMSSMIIKGLTPNIQVNLDLVDDLKDVHADPTQISQVIMNLVVNAKDAMPDGGKLTVRTENTLDSVLLSIRDTGTGMDVATKEKIFEPFFTTKEDKGSGLGLSTVYGIVNQSGGQIKVESEQGTGTTFKIYLPVIT